MISTVGFIEELQGIAAGGGWLFWCLMLLAFAIAHALLALTDAARFPDAILLDSRDWKRLLRSPERSSDAFKQLVASLAASADPRRMLEECARRLFARQERRFPLVFVMISAAPLLGLLGTVSGMFSTFSGMSTNRSEAPIDVISAGIFEALITTETGLVIGVPTFIVCAWLKSRHDSLVTRYQQLESRALGELSKATP